MSMITECPPYLPTQLASFLIPEQKPPIQKVTHLLFLNPFFPLEFTCNHTMDNSTDPTYTIYSKLDPFLPLHCYLLSSNSIVKTQLTCLLLVLPHLQSIFPQILKAILHLLKHVQWLPLTFQINLKLLF